MTISRHKASAPPHSVITTQATALSTEIPPAVPESRLGVYLAANINGSYI